MREGKIVATSCHARHSRVMRRVDPLSDGTGEPVMRQEAPGAPLAPAAGRQRCGMERKAAAISNDRV